MTTLTPDTPMDVFALASSRTLRRFILRWERSEDDHVLYIVQVMRNTLEARKATRKAVAVERAARRKKYGRVRSDWDSETAMQAGMAFGCDGYNDVMGY